MATYATIMHNRNVIEIPVEEDGTILLSTVKSQFSGATGLRYKVDGHVRAIRLESGKLYSPGGSWGNTVYTVVGPAVQPIPYEPTSILIVKNLAYTCSTEGLKEHFLKYGEIEKAIIAVERRTQRPKGYGFVKFKDMEAQRAAMSERQEFLGRVVHLALARRNRH